ncbi:hypothetical protein [Streptacidiphilus cavernicola]|uniref:Uncharacterized protein n=1 Tax=Streptacidiphilus cavernicola TaxID=3342716 RepID=A0ABV6VZI0_9ACTN
MTTEPRPTTHDPWPTDVHPPQDDHGPVPPLRVVTPGGDQAAGPRFRSLWTADQLMGTVFSEPKWAVPGIPPEGVTP